MKRFIIITLLCTILLCMSACSGDQLQSVIFEWDIPPKNIDPLLASEQGEITVVKNIFEPLMLTEEDGTLTYGAAINHSVDSSRLVYVFELNTNAKWSDGTPVTAADFVFNLQRAIDPKTNAVCAISLQSIKNAAEIISGALPADKLGVTASGNKLTVTLVKPDNNLLRTLSGVAGMPCNKDFFVKSGGKYGMTKDTILSNGPFYVSSWNTDQYMEALRITQNEHYAGKNTSTLYRVRFSYEDAENRFSRIKNSETDCGGMNETLLSTAEIQGINTLQYGMGVTSLVFNTCTSAAKNEDLRKALTISANIEGANPQLPKYITPAHCIMGENYLSGNSLYSCSAYSPSQGDFKALFDSATKNIDAEKLKDLTLYHGEDDFSKLYASYIVQSWQKDLGLYVTLTQKSRGEIEGLLKSGEYTFLVSPFYSNNNMAAEVLSKFTALSPYNAGCYVSEEFDRLVASGETASLQAAEKMLYNQNRVIPLFESHGAYCIGSKVTEYKLFPGSNILDFSKMK